MTLTQKSMEQFSSLLLIPLTFSLTEQEGKKNRVREKKEKRETRERVSDDDEREREKKRERKRDKKKKRQLLKNHCCPSVGLSKTVLSSF